MNLIEHWLDVKPFAEDLENARIGVVRTKHMRRNVRLAWHWTDVRWQDYAGKQLLAEDVEPLVKVFEAVS